MDLAFVWAVLIAFAVLSYVILDGFDLGVGILFPTLKPGRERDMAMNSVAPIWDGNETWLVLGGGGLFAAFPLAYSVAFSALYAPIIAMLLGLIFRGVAFEYRWKTERNQKLWDISFFGGSIVAAFAQGVTLGALIQGIEVADRAYAGGWWDWLTPFSLATGAAVVIGYALLGATWLVLKMEGDLHGHAVKLARFAGVGTLVMIGAVSIWTPLLEANYAERWFSSSAIFYVAPVPILTAAAAGALFYGLYKRRDLQPFVSALALFTLSFIGLGISVYPNVVPPSISIWDAAAPDKSLSFLLVGAAILLPIILGYTAYAYWVFRGKTRDTEGYH